LGLAGILREFSNCEDARCYEQNFGIGPLFETATVTIDLRERSVARGENPAEINQSPLELSRPARHLILDLPIGSKEGSYEVALPAVMVKRSGAQREWRNWMILKTDIDLAGVSPGLYLLGFGSPAWSGTAILFA
jgi:hypothetical protein